MSFGNFYIKVCEQLKAGYGWNDVVTYISIHPELMDIIYNQYRQNISDAGPLELQGVIESTALSIDQSTRSDPMLEHMRISHGHS